MTPAIVPGFFMCLNFQEMRNIYLLVPRYTRLFRSAVFYLFVTIAFRIVLFFL